MSRLRPFALLLGSALVVGAMTAPVSASADGATGATPVTPADVLTALSAAKTATATAEERGWSFEETYTENGATDRSTFAYDPATQRLIVSDPAARQVMVAVSHRGTYYTLPAYGSVRRLHRILAVVGRPKAAWIYEPDSTIDLESGPFAVADVAPDALLGQLTDADETTISDGATETAESDGSTTYVIPVTTVTGEVQLPGGDVKDTALVTLTVGADGALGAGAVAFTDEQVSKTFGYGRPDIALPKAGDTVSEARLNKGRPLLRMAWDLKDMAQVIAMDVVKSPHRAWGAVRIIRTDAVRLARIGNRRDRQQVFAHRTVAHGVRITATNPFTHAKVVFTVRAIGNRAVVRRG